MLLYKIEKHFILSQQLRPVSSPNTVISAAIYLMDAP